MKKKPSPGAVRRHGSPAVMINWDPTSQAQQKPVAGLAPGRRALPQTLPAGGSVREGPCHPAEFRPCPGDAAFVWTRPIIFPSPKAREAGGGASLADFSGQFRNLTLRGRRAGSENAHSLRFPVRICNCARSLPCPGFAPAPESSRYSLSRSLRGILLQELRSNTWPRRPAFPNGRTKPKAGSFTKFPIASSEQTEGDRSSFFPASPTPRLPGSGTE